MLSKCKYASRLPMGRVDLFFWPGSRVGDEAPVYDNVDGETHRACVFGVPYGLVKTFKKDETCVLPRYR